MAKRAIVVFESLAKPANSKWLWETLAKYGLVLGKNLSATGVVLDEVRDVKRRALLDGREKLIETIADDAAVLLVGNGPLEAITGKKGIKQKRGRPWQDGGATYLPTILPGAILYDDRAKPLIEADLRLFAEIVKRGKIPREEGLDWEIVEDWGAFEEMLDDLEGTVSFDVETNGLYAWAPDAKVISIGFGCRKRQWCLPLNHPESPWEEQDQRRMMRKISARLRHCTLVAHNGKFDNLWIRVHYGFDWRPDFDTMLAHYVLDENDRHGLKYLAQVYYGAPNYDADLDEKQGAGPLQRHCLYLAHDVYYTRKLRFTLGKLLSEDPGVEKVFARILMPIASLFCEIEFTGVRVDYDRYEEAEVHLRGEAKQAKREFRRILKEHGIDFDHYNGRWQPLNLGSPKQLAKLFFEDLEIPVLDKTGSGAPSTNESVLLRIEHPIARALLKWRGVDQNLKMFIDGWRGFLVKHSNEWRLHPSFKLHGTVTGRASCEHPNLQQVPRESLIRSLVTASLGWVLLEIDLSQIEMRIAAELSGDATLLGLFDRDEDVHWMTALREIARAAAMAEEVVETARKHLGKRLKYADAIDALLKMGPDRATELWSGWKEIRKKAKAVNFGYLFGMWWKKFVIYARDNYGIHVTDRQAQESRKNFFSLYKGLAPWHEKQKRFAMRNGYVRSLTGGKRRLPQAQSPHDSPERGEALRQAINSPVQRFACELNFMVLLQLSREFGLDVFRPVGTVHDATLAEVKLSHVPLIFKRALEIMRKPDMLEEFGIELRVPIKGDAKLGNWSKGISLEKFLDAQKEAA